MKIYILLFTCFVLLGCNNTKEMTHKNLIHFRTSFLAELGDDNYDTTKFEENSTQVDDFLILTKVTDLNACGVYKGNIEIKNDSLILKVILVSDEVCTSLSINKLNYIVYNPKKIKFKTKFKYE